MKRKAKVSGGLALWRKIMEGCEISPGSVEMMERVEQ